MKNYEILNKSDRKRRIKIPERHSELAELLGILTGDGFMNYYPKRQAYIIGIAGNKLKDLEYLENFTSKLIKNLFNLSPRLYLHKSQNTASLVFRSKSIFYFLEECGFPTGRKGEISIPKWILENPDFFKKFIRGVFDTDGHLCLKNKEGKKYPVIGITSKSKSLLFPIKEFLNSYGITSYLGSHRADTSNKKFIVNRVQISGQKNIGLFFDQVGSNNPRNLMKYMEMAPGGIEPSYNELQSFAFPLCYRASLSLKLREEKTFKCF